MSTYVLRPNTQLGLQPRYADLWMKQPRETVVRDEGGCTVSETDMVGVGRGPGTSLVLWHMLSGSLASPRVLFHNMINALRMSVKLCTQWHAMTKGGQGLGGLFQNPIIRASLLPPGRQGKAWISTPPKCFKIKWALRLIWRTGLKYWKACLSAFLSRVSSLLWHLCPKYTTTNVLVLT